MKASRTKTIPARFGTPEQASDFWDLHDAGDFPSAVRAVPSNIKLSKHLPRTVSLEHRLSKRLAHCAQQQGVSLDALVNAWLSQHVATHRKVRAA